MIEVFKEENIKVVKNSIKRVGSFYFSKLKNKMRKHVTLNIVYKLTCNTCQLVYVGQTRQWLESRMALQKSGIKKRVESCVLVGHNKGNVSHAISFDNVEILSQKKNYGRRIFLEIVYINKFNTSMNKKTDTQNLNVIYTCLLDNSFNNFYDGPVDE